MSNTQGMAAPGRWGDLRKRVGSALVMVLLGGAAIIAGGWALQLLACVVSGAMFWELAAMTAPRRGSSIWLGVLAAGCLLSVLVLHSPFALPLLLLAPLVGVVLRGRRDRIIFGLYGLAIMFTGYGLVALREGQGLAAILWILAVVVMSDVAGYFAGRALGGPKFWPRISPKKTWSGTVAGWLGAALIGLGFVLAGAGGAGLIWLSPLLAFAGQMGDIAESWIKRRAGVKDSSALIPGHGGTLDRFDALIGAVLLLIVLAQFGPLPLTTG